MLKKSLFLSLVTLVVACPVKAQEQGHILPLPDVLSYIYHQNPTILAARYSLRTVQEQYPQAAAGWQPRVSAEASLTSADIKTGNFSQGDGTTTKSASISVEQPLFRGFRTVAEMEAARRRIAAETQELRRIQQAVFSDAAEAYMNVIRDRLLLELQHKNVVLLSREKDSVSARFEAGDVTQTDVKQTDARYSRAIADDATAESTLQASEAAFEKITGMWPSEILVMPEIAFTFPKTRDDLVRRVAAQNPVLSSRRNAHEAAEEDIRAAKSDFYPQFTAYASHIKEYDPQPGIIDESETSTIGLRARFSLYEGGATLSRVREAKSRANQRFVETIEAEQTLRGDSIALWRRIVAFDAEIGAREMEVTAARYSAEGVREEARLGDRTVLDTLEADQDVLDAESALVEARSSRIVTAYRLAAALGMLDAAKIGIPGVDPAAEIATVSAE